MSHAEKSAAYQELKAAGVQFDRTYQQYSTEELVNAVAVLRQSQPELPPEGSTPNYGTPQIVDQAPPETWDAPGYSTIQDEAQLAQEFDAAFQVAGTATRHRPLQAPPGEYVDTTQAPAPGEYHSDVPDVEAGLRLNSGRIRIDSNGLRWHQDEVRKPAYPKQRKRRVLKYIDPGVKQQTVKAGEYMETFEVAGDERREAEVKVSLPSYQVGIYEDPRFPGFKVHVYNDQRAFDLFDVQDFYGGAELVPADVKRVYIANDLCYDIRTLVRAMEREAREIDLRAGKGI